MTSVTRASRSCAASSRFADSSAASARYDASASAARRAERGGVRGFGERREPCLRFRAELGQRFRPDPVLARHVVDRRQPLLDPREFRRVDLQFLPIPAQRARGLLDPDARGLEQRDDLGERGVVRRMGVELRDQRRQPGRQRVVAVGELLLARRRRLDQRRGVREPRLRLRQRDPFVGGDVERRELAPARLQHLALGGGGLRRLRRRIAPLDGRVPFAPRARHGAAQGREAAEAVDERALHVGRRERLVRVLAVQVDEPLADLVQLRERRGPAVDPGATPALRVERPAQQERAVGRGEVVRSEPLGDARAIVHVERGGELGPVGARPELPQLETVAQQQREGVEQDRLARARLAGQHGEAAVELEVERFDDDEIADGQQPEHEYAGQIDLPTGEMSVGNVIGRVESCRRIAEQPECATSRKVESDPTCFRRRSGVSLQCSFSRNIAK